MQAPKRRPTNIRSIHISYANTQFTVIGIVYLIFVSDKNRQVVIAIEQSE